MLQSRGVTKANMTDRLNNIQKYFLKPVETKSPGFSQVAEEHSSCRINLIAILAFFLKDYHMSWFSLHLISPLISFFLIF